MDGKLSELTRQARTGRMGRRDFIRRAAGLGLTVTAAGALFEACAAAPSGGPTGAAAPTAAPAQAAAPAKRGGGGTLKILSTLHSDGVYTNLNPHHNDGGDLDVARMMFEPLASIDPDTKLQPILAAEIPSASNGGLDPSGKSVTWRLKKDVVWHDGKPFTADDVIFTWEYTSDRASGTVSSGAYSNIASIDKIDDHGIKITFKDPTPLWWRPFTSEYGMILPKHLMSSFKGAAAKNAPLNTSPIGTGPYKFSQLKPGDVAIAELFDKYHVAGRPFFDKVEFKNGGGDGALAARAVMQTGEHDFAFNLHLSVDKLLLQGLDKPDAVGKIVVFGGTSTEHLQLNQTDPNAEVDGERSSLKTKHPLFSDPQVRQAVSLAVDRKTIARELGPIGAPPAVYMAFQGAPKYFPASDPKEEKYGYDPAKANQLLDAAGWTRGADGVRAKAGKRMKVLYQAASSAQRQATQAAVKKNLEAIGFDVELKAVPGGVFNAANPDNPDNLYHFYADIQMYSAGLGGADPQGHMARWISSRIPQKANKYVGLNASRYQNAEFDRLYDQALKEMDEQKRTAAFQRMNEILAGDNVVIGIWHNSGVAAVNKKLKGYAFAHAWEPLTWNIAFWTRE